jgi:hypothetical protein
VVIPSNKAIPTMVSKAMVKGKLWESKIKVSIYFLFKLFVRKPQIPDRIAQFHGYIYHPPVEDNYAPNKFPSVGIDPIGENIRGSVPFVQIREYQSRSE